MLEIKLNNMTSDRKTVGLFLEELHNIIDSDTFSIERNLSVILKNKPDDIKHSTPYTLIDLGFDVEDIVPVIRHLSIEDYSETLYDDKDENPPLLYVFGTEINNKQIYIKLKIKKKKSKYILCLSFHYAAHDMSFPYSSK